MKKARKQVTTSPPEHPAFPHANGFNGLWRALPGEPGLFATIVSAMRKHCRQLDISFGMSGPHAFAVREPAPSSLA
jgi:hypothetical protein